MRWDFPDPSDVEEARQRDAVTAAMDRWWQAFAAHADRVDAHFAKGEEFDIVGFTNSHLHPVDEGLTWEYGPAERKTGHRLVITPEGKHELQPLLRELLRRAPELPRWEFYPGRLPAPPEVAFGVAEQIARFKADDLQVRISLGKYRRVDLQFHIANAKGNEDAALNYAFRATEQMLGEAVLDNWIGVIDLAPPQSIVKRLFGGRPAGLVSPQRLKPTVDALIAASRDQLPDPPPRVLAQRNGDDPRVEWSSFKFEPGEAYRDDYPAHHDLFYAGTCEPQLFEAAMNDRVFHSARFSRSGETFAYLKFDRREDDRGSPPIDSADARTAIEEAVNAALGANALGCTTGGGSGVMYAYVDVALTDVPRAIPVLRDLLPRRHLNRRSWLLFFDAQLADEWVGIYDDTPSPPPRRERQQ